MILTIENSDNSEKIKHSEVIYSMCEFYIEALDIGDYDIMLSVILHDSDKVDDVFGYCEWDPKEKLAEVHLAMKGPAWGVTLAHELVHVKQNLEFGTTSEELAYQLEYPLYEGWQATCGV
jgi:hypothetical protein